MIGPNPSVSKSNRLHVVVFRFCSIDFRCIPHIPLKGSIVFPKVLTFKWLFLEQIGSTVNLAVCSPHSLIQDSMVLKSNFNVGITLFSIMVVLGGPKHLTKVIWTEPKFDVKTPQCHTKV
jgi:hypothetical protein